MISLVLKYWQSKGELEKLRVACQSFWDLLEYYMQFPLQQMDIETCTVGVLELFAWQRNINRLKNEPESLFRKRVKYAFVNSKDSGSVAGFIRIFQRLGIGDITIEERNEFRDWDIIMLHLSDDSLAEFQFVLNDIVLQYGRLCRRYELVTITDASVPMAGHEFNHSWGYASAEWTV